MVPGVFLSVHDTILLQSRKGFAEGEKVFVFSMKIRIVARQKGALFFLSFALFLVLVFCPCPSFGEDKPFSIEQVFASQSPDLELIDDLFEHFFDPALVRDEIPDPQSLHVTKQYTGTIGFRFLWAFTKHFDVHCNYVFHLSHSVYSVVFSMANKNGQFSNRYIVKGFDSKSGLIPVVYMKYVRNRDDIERACYLYDYKNLKDNCGTISFAVQKPDGSIEKITDTFFFGEVGAISLVANMVSGRLDPLPGAEFHYHSRLNGVYVPLTLKVVATDNGLQTILPFGDPPIDLKVNFVNRIPQRFFTDAKSCIIKFFKAWVFDSAFCLSSFDVHSNQEEGPEEPSETE